MKRVKKPKGKGSKLTKKEKNHIVGDECDKADWMRLLAELEGAE